MDYEVPKIKVLKFNEANGFYTTPERSKIMSKIRSKNTKPELLFRKALWKTGFRYRVHHSKLPGKPDLSNKKPKLAIFIDGEFWHGRNWEEKKPKIKTNKEFWISKIERNRQRDEENNQKLSATVLRFWESDVKKNLQHCLDTVYECVNKNSL
ncbi:MAG: very short patch repair endonuclease [Bacteroidota bacterium]